jgi:phage terminase small subunit
MPTPEEVKLKKDKFVEAYLGEAQGNQTKAAIIAGYSQKRAGVTSSELMKDPYVLERIRQATDVKKDFTTDKVETIEDIFAETGSKALRKLANAAENDIDAAQKFLKLKLDFEKRKKEELGEYEGLSTQEIIGRFNSCVERGRELIQRVVETAGTEDLPRGSDVFILGSTCTQRPTEKPVGQSPPQDLSGTEDAELRGPSTSVDPSWTSEVDPCDPELDTTAITEEPDVEDTDCLSEPEES